jgi:methionyl-tRNA formyltransferase
MLINEKLDEGLLTSQDKLRIDQDDDTPKLTQKLIELSNKMLGRDIPLYLDSKVKPYPQPDQVPTYSRKLVKEDGVLDWAKPAQQLEREVRAYAGWPRSATRVFGHKIIVTKARIAKPSAGDEKDKALIMRANPGWLEIIELIAPSGRKMSGADFLRGYKN